MEVKNFTDRELELIKDAILYHGQHIAIGQSGGEEVLPEFDEILNKIDEVSK